MKYIFTLLFCVFFLSGNSQSFEKVKDSLKNKYESIGDLYNGLAKVTTEYETKTAFLSDGTELEFKAVSSQIGFIDSLGNLVIPFQEYNWFLKETQDVFVVKQDSLYALMNRKGEYIRDYIIKDLNFFISTNGVHSVFYKDNSTSLINTITKKDLFEPIKNHKIELSYKEYYVILDLKTQKKGLINEKGDFLIPCSFDEISIGFPQIENNCVIVKNNNKWGINSLNNEVIIPIEYKYVFPTTNKNVFIAVNDYGGGIINQKNEVIYPFINSDIKPLSKKYFLVQKDNFVGVVDDKGKTILPINYEAYSVHENTIYACDEKDCFVFNFTDKKIKTIKLDKGIKFIRYNEKTSKNYLYSIKNQIFIKNGKYGLLGKNGKTLIQPTYQEIKNIYETEYYIVKNNDLFGLMDEYQNIIVKIKYTSTSNHRRKICFHNENTNEKECIELDRF